MKKGNFISNIPQNIVMHSFFLMRGLISALLLLTVSIATAQMTCPVKTSDPTNLIGANASFENTTIDFTSVAAIDLACSNGAKAAICTDPGTQSNNAYVAKVKDHTTGNGNLLFVDVNGTVADQVVYSKASINVTPGRTYIISAWFANGNGNTSYYTSNGKWENSPILSFNIKNNTTGVTSQLGGKIYVDSTSNPVKWQQFYQVWTAPAGVTSVDFIIQNEKVTGSNAGNDLVIDDLVFNSSCDGIKDLKLLGKASSLVDTVFTCNENFAFTLNTNLTNSKYNFQWFLNSSGNKVEGTPGMDATNITTANTKDNTSDNIYSVATAPIGGTKYYVCYDSLGDGLVCPRLDSVLFLNQFDLSLGPDRKVCPPVSELLDPSLTTTNISTYKYEMISPTAIPGISGAGTGTVPTYTATKAGTYKLTVVHANTAACGTKTATIKIDTLVAAFNGAINASCTGSTATGTVDLVPNITGTSKVTIIGGLANVSWFKSSSGTIPEYGPFKSADGKGTTSAVNLVSTPACPQGGLFLQDNNSYATRAKLTEPSGCSIQSVNGPGAGYQKIVVTAPMTIGSVDLYAISNNTSSGDNLTLDLLLYPDITDFNNVPAPITTVASRNLVGYTKSMVKETVYGNGYLIQPGTYYLRARSYITGNVSSIQNLGYYTCKGPAANYKDSTGVLTLTDLNVYNGVKTTEHGALFNLKANIGNPTSCGRVWVCATCTLPVEYTYFNVYPTGGKDVLITWGTAHESKNRVFVVEASSDGVNFTAVAEVGGSHNSHLQKDYSVQQTMTGERQYYRIKQVDHDGKFTYTPVKFVSLNGSDAIGEVYPQPVKHGEVLHVKINGLIDTQLTLKLQSISGFDISEQTVAIGENTEAITFNTAGLTAGVYLLLINNTDFAKTIRVVVE